MGEGKGEGKGGGEENAFLIAVTASLQALKHNKNSHSSVKKLKRIFGVKFFPKKRFRDNTNKRNQFN